MVGKKDLKAILIAGLGSGFGFQIIEDLGYVARQKKSSQLAAVTEAINRISGGLASHALYTAVVSVGFFLLLSQVTQQKEKLFGLWCVLSTTANSLWNSPFYETDHRINLLGLLFAVQVGTFIEVVLYTKKHSELPFFKTIRKNFSNTKESGTEIGNSLELDFVVPPPHSWVGL